MVLISIECECKRACVSAGTWREHPAQVQPAAESGDRRFEVVVLGVSVCSAGGLQGPSGVVGSTNARPHAVLDCHPFATRGTCVDGPTGEQVATRRLALRNELIMCAMAMIDHQTRMSPTNFSEPSQHHLGCP